MDCSKCDGCKKTTGEKKDTCPTCCTKGLQVSYNTVFALAKPYLKNTLTDGVYFLCTSRKCPVAYYNRKKRTIMAEDVDCEIWFKVYRKHIMVCYCRDISLDDVVFAVSKLETPTIPKVVHFLQKADIVPDCILKNPTGVTCEKLFSNAIEYAKKINNIKGW